jgi:hypothetical protein
MAANGVLYLSPEAAGHETRGIGPGQYEEYGARLAPAI